MILQHFIFPKKGLCDKKRLYFRKETGNVRILSGGLQLAAAGSVSFFSYFNAFSLTRWRDYTGIAQYRMGISVCGKGRIRLRRAVLKGGRIYDTCLEQKEFYTEPDACTEIRFEIAPDTEDGMLYAQVCADTEVRLDGGYFGTEREPAAEVCIAAGICTFHREEYVYRTLGLLEKAFLENQNSPLYGKIRVYVADNGGTLDSGGFGRDVCVFRNKNAGGAGGFAGCMLRALEEPDACRYTHFLFMDDDILLEPETVYRTYMLLAAGVRYEHAAVGGALLRMDMREVQHACGENWEMGTIRSPKAGLDLSVRQDLLLNEKEIPVQYNGWWYCCVPFHKKTGVRLPLPLFLHGDDIAYGLQSGYRLLYLNGISVWHDAFENRRASCMEYYDIRNTLLLVSAFCADRISRIRLERRVMRHMTGQFLKYRYRDMDLTVRAVRDFCKGAEFLIRQDPQALHKSILSQGYHPRDMTEKLDRIEPEWRNREHQKHEKAGLYQKKQFSLHQLLFLNGWLLPACGKTKAFPAGVWAGRLFWYKKVLYYDPASGTGFLCRRRYRELFHLVKNAYSIHRLLGRHFQAAVCSYRKHCDEMVSVSFWKKYLGDR